MSNCYSALTEIVCKMTLAKLLNAILLQAKKLKQQLSSIKFYTYCY